jgi:hypothetical protein
MHMFSSKSIKTILFTLIAFVLAVSVLFSPSPARAIVSVADVSVTETWSDSTVHFTIWTNKPGLVEFIVGNNEASYAWVGTSNVPLYTDGTYTWSGLTLTTEEIIVKDDGTVLPDDGTWRDFKGHDLWPAGMEGFGDYTNAFFFTSNPQYVISSSNWTPLSTGTTYFGFYGSTLVPASPFAARFLDDTILYGQTNTTVPEPITLLFLGLGVIGFAGIGRKFRRK